MSNLDPMSDGEDGAVSELRPGGGLHVMVVLVLVVVMVSW